MNMAAGVCVTSFRMLLRRSDLSHLSRGLRLKPVTAIAANSWSLRGRCYATDKYDAYIEDANTGKTNNEKASASASVLATQSKPGKHKNTTVPGSSGDGIENNHKNKNAHKVAITNENQLEDAAELAQLKVADLKAQLRACGLATGGRKQDLIERLQSTRTSKVKFETNDLHENATDTRLLLTPSQTSSTLSTSTTTLQTTTITTPISEQQDAPVFEAPTTTATLATFSLPTVRMLDNAEKLAADSAVSSDDHVEHNKHSDSEVEEDEDANVASSDEEDDGAVCVTYIQGLPHLTVPLPSRNEKCRFALKPVTHKVGDLIDMLKTEDRGIDRALVLNEGGVRIASTCNIESLMDEPFWLFINDLKYKVVPPKREKINAEDIDKLGDIRSLVTQLYEALNVGEYHIQKESELVTKLEDLKYKITPLERKKEELSIQAERKTNVMAWVGLGLMSMQFGILARLTWWEYSWDIMEPVTYFVTYGTVMAMYAYYCVTKQEYEIPDVRDRQYLLTLHKRAKKRNFDIEEYNNLKRQIATIEYDLRRLRDPLNLQLPPRVDRAQRGPPADPASTVLVEKVACDKKSSFKLPFFEPKK